MYKRTDAMVLKLEKSQRNYLLAVSGGMDSMILCDLFLKQNLNFAIAHCNFQLRGEDSLLDEQFVKAWCERHAIRFFAQRFDTNEFAQHHNLSIQVAARELRYAYFKKLQGEGKFDVVATAHHQDDNIETTLFHFFRGTGLKGLTGIPYKNESIVRPILHVKRSEMLSYAKEHEIAYRQDISNLKQDYTRNKIRLSVIPALEETFPTLKQNIAQNIERLSQVYSIYQQQIETYKKMLLEKRGKEFYIPILKLRLLQAQETILYEILKPFEFSFQQACQVLQLTDRQSGTHIDTSKYRAIRHRNFIVITKLESIASEQILITPDMTQVVTADFTLQIKQVDAAGFKLNLSKLECHVDAKELEYPLLLRKWRQGDYMYPFGMTKKKKVARIMIDAKIPLHEKEHIWVLESNQKIIWIVGLKTDNRFRIKPQTQTIVSFSI
jgi:tRNA(Ile)-lysidine synthase